MSTILVTGGTGYVGRHLIALLRRSGHRVVAVCRSPDVPVPLQGIISAPDIVVWSGDPLDLIRQGAELRLDAAVHLATLYRRDHTPDDLVPMVEANLELGMALLEMMSRQPGRRVVYANTAWQDSGPEGSPVNLYAATKRAFAEILRYYTSAHGIQAVSLVMADTYGEDDQRPRFLNAVRRSWQAGQPLVASPGGQIVDMLHVDDVCEAMLHALTLPLQRPFEEYALQSGEPASLQELVGIIGRITGKPPAVTWGGRPYAPREVFRPLFSAPPLTGWKPRITLEAGLRRVFAPGAGAAP